MPRNPSGRRRAASPRLVSETPVNRAAVDEAARQRVEQNPTTRTFEGGNTGTHTRGRKAKPAGRQLVVTHGAVGPYARGTVVHESDFGDAENLKRLLDLGAVEWQDKVDEVEDLPPGDQGQPIHDITLDENSQPEPIVEPGFHETQPTVPMTVTEVDETLANQLPEHLKQPGD